MIIFISVIALLIIIGQSILLVHIERKGNYFRDKWTNAVDKWGETIEDWGESRTHFQLLKEKYLELYDIVYKYDDSFPVECRIEIREYSRKHYPQAYDENGNVKPVEQLERELREEKEKKNV